VKTYMLVELVIGRKEGRISERELASLGLVGGFNDEHDIVEGGTIAVPQSNLESYMIRVTFL
jgi:hypothetical protein